MQDFRQLDAFRLADDLAYSVYVASRRWPRHEIWGLTDQVRRAAVSVASNIAEGCGRHSRADYLRFLDAATGSAFELEYQLTLAQRLGYMDADSGWMPIAELAFWRARREFPEY